MSELHKFIFEGLPVRGAIVRLTDSWQEILRRRERHAGGEVGAGKYPELVQNLLGEMTAAAVLMQGNIKFNGSLILQVMGGEKSSGRRDMSPVKLAVVEVKSDLTFRTTAKVVHSVTGHESFSQLINAGNQARCAITLDPEVKFQGQQPYQSIVPLYDDQGDSLESFASVLEHYMLQSEQLDTKLVLAANADIAVGILIQRMPIKGENNLAGAFTSTENEDAIGKNEDFNRIATLTASIKNEELLTLSVDDILHRLFWQEPIARYEPANPAPRFQCTCSRDRVANTIRSLGQTEAERMIEERDGIQVNCDFCGQSYEFDVIDAAMLFLPAASVVSAKS
jgi:molecular chaperone Hsp33